MNLKITNVTFDLLTKNNNIVQVPKDLQIIKDWLHDGCSDEFIANNPISDLQAIMTYVRTALFQTDPSYTVEQVSGNYTHTSGYSQPYYADVYDQDYEEFESYEVHAYYENEHHALITADDIMYHDIKDIDELREQAAYEWLMQELNITFSFRKL